MQGNIPPDAQETIQRLQTLQEQAQQVLMQKNDAERALQEAKTASDLLEDVDPETTMYRDVGELMIETDYESASSDLEETIQRLEIRVETLGKQEDRIESQFQELQEELQSKLGDVAGGI